MDFIIDNFFNDRFVEGKFLKDFHFDVEGTTSSSTTTTTTTSFTAPPRCAPMAGQVLFFLPTEIVRQLFNEDYGKIEPVCKFYQSFFKIHGL